MRELADANTLGARKLGAHIRRHVFPQAPSPTMTSLRRISAMTTTHATHVSERRLCGMKDGFE